MVLKKTRFDRPPYEAPALEIFMVKATSALMLSAGNTEKVNTVNAFDDDSFDYFNY